MYAQLKKPKESKSRAITGSVAQNKSNGKEGFRFVDNRPEAIAQRKLQEMSNHSFCKTHITMESQLTNPFHTIQKASKEQVIQLKPLWASIKTDSKGIITSTKMDGDRPPGNLRSHTGDHTTPYISFLHIAVNNVQNRSLVNAVKNLKIVMQRIQEFPGYAKASSYVKSPLDKLANPWISWASSVTDPNEKEVQQMMVAVVHLRNAVPLSAYHNIPSTGGNNEANTAGGLHHAESLARAGKKLSGNPLVNVFETFDWAAPGTRSFQEWADLLNQHILSIRESYPILFELGGYYSLSDILNYLKSTVLFAKFSKSDANSIKALL